MRCAIRPQVVRVSSAALLLLLAEQALSYEETKLGGRYSRLQDKQRVSGRLLRQVGGGLEDEPEDVVVPPVNQKVDKKLADLGLLDEAEEAEGEETELVGPQLGQQQSALLGAELVEPSVESAVDEGLSFEDLMPDDILSEQEGVTAESEDDYGDITQPDPFELIDGNGASDVQVAASSKQGGAAAAKALELAGSRGSALSSKPPVQELTQKLGGPRVQIGEIGASSGSEDEVPADVEQSWEQGLAAHGGLARKNTTTKKVTPLTEKSSHATETEEETLNVLSDLQDPITESSLDTSLATEKAVEEARLEEIELGAPSAGSSTIERESEEPFVKATSVVAEQARPRSPPTEQQYNFGTEDMNGPEDPAASDSTILSQGVIISSTLKDMVKSNAGSVAGTLAVIVAVLAGLLVAVVGIAIYRRMRRGREGRSSPRIIEIGSLAQRSKSPTYARVGHQNQDDDNPSGARWQDGWEDAPQKSTSLTGAGVKQKKAWDWDANW